MPPFVPVDDSPDTNRIRVLQSMFYQIRSEDSSKYLTCTICLKELLSSDNPPVNEVLHSRVIPRLVEFTASDIPGLKFEAASVLSVFSRTDNHLEVFIGSGAVPVFIQLLSSNSSEELQLAVSTLENVACHRPQDVVSHQEFLPALYSLGSITDSETIQERICKTVSHQEVIASVIMRFVIRMLKHGNLMAQQFAVSAIAGLTSDENVCHIKSLVSEGCIKRLVGVLDSTHALTVERALSALDDILRSFDRDLCEGFNYIESVFRVDGYEIMVRLKEEHDEIRVKNLATMIIDHHLAGRVMAGKFI